MARGVPLVAARLAEDDPEAFPPAERVWADWLHGDHAPGYRREVLAEFASDFIGGARSDIPAAVRVLSSVKVLGEGVDTAQCDAVAFCDARGSVVDIVQMVGRALRLSPGEGKLASLVVPVFLGPDEDVDELLTSDAYGTLAKVLRALRAHDADTIEALADPRQRSGRRSGDEDIQVPLPGIELRAEGAEDDREADEGAGDDVWVSQAAVGPLRFSTPRDPSLVATVRAPAGDRSGRRTGGVGSRRPRGGGGRTAAGSCGCRTTT
ncbi:helicase-related protein [Streptomyces olivaceoviridis]|uniref:helicase-related protein n=1 Tax=Streptomyces olivaceoviridis TaxID=1921 RepID=UPI003682B396